MTDHFLGEVMHFAARRCVAPAIMAAATLCAVSSPVSAAEAACAVSAAAAEDVIIAASEPRGLLRLADGRLAQLAGIDALSARIPDYVGHAASLFAAAPPDRRGHIHARFIIDGDDVAEAAVSKGLAIVRPRPGSEPCYADLLAAEDAARRQGLGLWRDQEYGVLNAAAPQNVAQKQGRFAIITGTLVHVGETRDALWLDFGHEWRSDVTIVVARRDRAAFTAAGLTAATLRGRRIRARGVVTMASGPRLDISMPAAIEILDGPAGP